MTGLRDKSQREAQYSFHLDGKDPPCMTWTRITGTHHRTWLEGCHEVLYWLNKYLLWIKQYELQGSFIFGIHPFVSLLTKNSPKRKKKYLFVCKCIIVLFSFSHLVWTLHFHVQTHVWWSKSVVGLFLRLIWSSFLFLFISPEDKSLKRLANDRASVSSAVKLPDGNRFVTWKQALWSNGSDLTRN